MKKSNIRHPNARLLHERELRGWSQEYLAEKIGSTPLNISRWERGVSFPVPYYRRLLCELFGKSAEELDLIQKKGDKAQSSSSSPQAIVPRQEVKNEEHGQFWFLPYPRNVFFSGREYLLTHIWECLSQNKKTVTLAQVALSGLGGIGKTQIAIEYAYRYREQYRSVLWVNAASRSLLLSDYVKIAELLSLPESASREQELAIRAVKQWLSQHDSWLLILDNADDLTVVSEFFPQTGKGHLLLTTRDQAVASIASRIVIEKMDQDEGTLFLLRRVGILLPDAQLDQASKADRTRAEAIVMAMDGLPLALDQAGAYLIETACGLSRYLELYQKWRQKLLKRRGRVSQNHSESVVTTFSLCFQQVEIANPAAAELLRFCAFLHPDAIPEELIAIGAALFNSPLQSVVQNQTLLEEAVGDLLRYSLVSREAQTRTLAIHRLVQAVLKDEMTHETLQLWAERTIRAVNAVFPDVAFLTWVTCQQYLAHAQVCADLINDFAFTFPEASQLLHHAGCYLQERANYTQAELLLKQSLSIREKALEPDHLDVATTLHHLAQLYRSQAEYAEAERLFQRAFSIRERTLGIENSDTTDSLDHLAQLVYVQSRYSEAEQLFQQVLAVREKLFGLMHPLTADTLDHLGQLTYVQSNYPQAEQLFQRALLIREKSLSSEHPDIADTLHHLGQLAYARAQYTQAKRFFQRALSIREKVLGLEHPRTADTFDHLAQITRSQGHLAEAELLFQRVLTIREKILGSKHPNTADTLDNLAQLYQAQGRYSEAESTFQRALAIREDAFGAEHPRTAGTLNNMGQLYQVQGRYEQAGILLQKALHIREKAFGSSHPYTAATLDHLGELAYAQLDYSQAESLFQRSLAIREKTFGPEHPRTATTLDNLAQLYQAQGKFSEAEALFQRALASREKILGLAHPDTIAIMNRLIEFYLELGNSEKAEELKKLRDKIQIIE